jgi:hypothetical protein
MINSEGTGNGEQATGKPTFKKVGLKQDRRRSGSGSALFFFSARRTRVRATQPQKTSFFLTEALNSATFVLGNKEQDIFCSLFPVPCSPAFLTSRKRQIELSHERSNK